MNETLRLYQEFLRTLNKHLVRYLIIGGHAYSVHREMRATKDLDVFIESSKENAPRVFAALAEFGAPLAGYTPEDFAKEDGTWFGFGNPPTRFDVLQSIDGKDFATAWKNRVEGELFEVPVSVISRDDLIDNKLAAGRDQDLIDVKNLRKFSD